MLFVIIILVTLLNIAGELLGVEYLYSQTGKSMEQSTVDREEPEVEDVIDEIVDAGIGEVEDETIGDPSGNLSFFPSLPKSKSLVQAIPPTTKRAKRVLVQLPQPSLDVTSDVEDETIGDPTGNLSLFPSLPSKSLPSKSLQGIRPTTKPTTKRAKRVLVQLPQPSLDVTSDVEDPPGNKRARTVDVSTEGTSNVSMFIHTYPYFQGDIIYLNINTFLR